MSAIIYAKFKMKKCHLSLQTFFIAEVGGRLLVDAVVCEVGEDVMYFGAFIAVLVGSEPDQPVIIEVDTQGVHAGDEHVQAEVKLGLIYQVRSGNIPWIVTII